MPLTLSAPKTPVILGPPAYVLNRRADPDWRRVETVASRFHLPSHRRAVRVYLYATIRDVDALHRWADDLLYRRKLRNAARRGRDHLAEARRKYPEEFAAMMAGFAQLGA